MTIARRGLLAGVSAAVCALLFTRRQRHWVSRTFEITLEEHKVTVVYNDGTQEIFAEGFYSDYRPVH